MKTLIPQAEWLQDVIHLDELQAWNPQAGPCCTPARFKLHLSGTPRNDWNISASRVFTDHFLITHSDSYEDTWEVYEMVLKKTQAYIKSLIKLYRQQFIGNDVVLKDRIAQRRYTRKVNVSYFHIVVDQS